MIRQRELIKGGVAGIGALALGPAFWEGAMAASARPGPGPYGPLGPADANGLRLPPGFSSRLIAQGEVPVPGTAYVWHGASDGSATYALGDGGWILVSNSEIPGDVGGRGLGGASAIRFRSDGSIADAYRILEGARGSTAPAARRRGTPGCRVRRSTPEGSGSATSSGRIRRWRAPRWASSLTRRPRWTRTGAAST